MRPDARDEAERYYIPTRYPNGLPGGIPADAFSAEDAASALRDAVAVLGACGEAIGGQPRRT